MPVASPRRGALPRPVDAARTSSRGDCPAYFRASLRSAVASARTDMRAEAQTSWSAARLIYGAWALSAIWDEVWELFVW